MITDKRFICAFAGGQCAGKKTALEAVRDRLLQVSQNRLVVECLHMSDFLKDGKVGEEGALEEDRERIESYDLEYLADTLELYRAPKSSSSLNNLTDYQLNKSQSSAATRLPDEASKLKSHSRERSPLADIGTDVNVAQSELTQDRVQHDQQRNARPDVTNNLQNVDVILVEGPYLLATQRLRELTDVKIFVDVDADARLSRRVLRDTELRHIPLDKVFDTYIKYAKHAYESHIEPTKGLADIILPQGAITAAIELIAMGIWDDISVSLLPSATISTDQQQQTRSQSTSRKHSQQLDINQQENSGSSNRDHENTSCSSATNHRAMLGAGFRSMSASYSPTPSITLGEVDVDSYQPL